MQQEKIKIAKVIHNLLNGEDGYANTTIEKDKIHIYVTRKDFYLEIVDIFEKIENVFVFCGLTTKRRARVVR